VEIQQLRHLIAAVKHRSFAKAAEEANITQPGISRSIRSLEVRLGVPLLERGAGGIEPTVFGLTVLRRAQVILNEVSRTKDELRALELANVGELTFAVSQNFAHYFLPKVLAKLHQRHPLVRYNVVTAGTLEVIDQVRDASVDFSFGLVGTVAESEGLHFEYLKQHRSAIACRAQHPLASKEVITPSDLAQAAWITVSSSGFQRSFRNFFLSRGLVPPQPSIATNSLALIRRTLAEADLLTAIPRDIVQHEVETGQLAFLNSQALANYTRIGFVTRVDCFVTPQMKDAMTLIREELLADETPSVEPYAAGNDGAGSAEPVG